MSASLGAELLAGVVAALDGRAIATARASMTCCFEPPVGLHLVSHECLPYGPSAVRAARCLCPVPGYMRSAMQARAKTAMGES
eukprot:3609369-Pyramimonas_sp.AAC.1